MNFAASMGSLLATLRRWLAACWQQGRPGAPARPLDPDDAWYKASYLALVLTWLTLGLALLTYAGFDALLAAAARIGGTSGAGGTALHDFLTADKAAAGMAVIEAWNAGKLRTVWWDIPALALWLDALVIVPAYVLAFGALARRLRVELEADGTKMLLGWDFQVILCWLIPLLALVDEIENGLGLVALHLKNSPDGVYTALAWTSQAKFTLLAIVAILLALLLSLWFFNLPRGNEEVNEGENDQRLRSRLRMRRAVADIVWRSKYVLGGLVVFGGINLLSDQTRDVLIGMVSLGQDASGDGFWSRYWPYFITLFALWLLVQVTTTWLRIVCRIRDPNSRQAALRRQNGDNVHPGGTFAKWWARIVGASPILFFYLASMHAAADGVTASDPTAAHNLARLGLFVLGLNLGWLVWRAARVRLPANQDLTRYYNCADSMGDLIAGGQSTRGFWEFGLPALALLLFVGVRWLYLDAAGGSVPQASPALALVTLIAAFWIACFGWLAQLEIRRSTPYVFFAVMLAGIFGYLGLTENHIIPVWGGTAMRAVPAALALWGAGLAGLGLLTLWTLWRLRTRFASWASALANAQDTDQRIRHLIPPVSIMVLGMLIWFGFIASANTVLKNPVSTPTEQPMQTGGLSETLDEWLFRLCSTRTECMKPEEGQKQISPLPIYFISAEGGGIRAAYWTSLALNQLSKEQPDFVDHTFSLSGVSGGALGMAVWRACHDNPQREKVDECIRSFGKADLLTPLTSTWFFEDVLARSIPTSWCTEPGCGFLSRGLWFERTLETAVPAMRNRLERKASSNWHPYLFLNATWLETGERAIASDHAIYYRDFPTARDQRRFLGNGLALSTAAHNASRFPYSNAVGAVQADAKRCDPAQTSIEKGPDSTPPCKHCSSEKPRICGRLVDGGYSENSGTRTTFDILNGLRRVLAPNATTKKLSQKQREWLRQHLAPTVILIRNGVPKKEPDSSKDPALPRRAGKLNLFPDAFGPMVAALNSVGTGVQARYSDASLRRSVIQLYSDWRQPIPSVDPVRPINQINDGTLYPLGWYLSTDAKEALEKQAFRIQFH